MELSSLLVATVSIDYGASKSANFSGVFEFVDAERQGGPSDKKNGSLKAPSLLQICPSDLRQFLPQKRGGNEEEKA